MFPLGNYKSPRCNGWNEECYSSHCIIKPLKGNICTRSFGVIILGISPRREFDEMYLSFMKLLKNQIISIISNAKFVT